MICNICGSSEFTTPTFRLANESQLVEELRTDPQCINCYSLERHRISKEVYFSYRKDNPQTTLLFSADATKHFLPDNTEISIYSGLNSLDVTDIDRESDTYDLIFCQHILQYVENDRVAFDELCRVLKPGGQIYWSVSWPSVLESTTVYNPPLSNSYSGPPEPDYFQYKDYGSDFIETVNTWSAENNVTTTVVYGVDVVTNFRDLIFITEK